MKDSGHFGHDIAIGTQVVIELQLTVPATNGSDPLTNCDWLAD